MNKAEIKAHMAQLNCPPDDKFIELIEKFDDAELCNRKNFVGHITASGTIVHFESKEVLLLHHKFLDAWHVPGGHVDPEDESTVAAALREVEEETGITADQLTPINEVDDIHYCVEINSHPIPRNEKKNEDAHYHHDFRYIFGYSGDKDIHIDNNESLNYKWVSIEDEYLAKILDVKYLKELLYKHPNWNLSEEEDAEMTCHTYSSIAQIEGMARFDIVKTKDKTGVRQRGDRRIFNKDEGRYLYFYSETDLLRPNDIDWKLEMRINIKGKLNRWVHKCASQVGRSFISIDEYVDISELPCGEYTFELENDFGELYSFEFHLIDAPKSYKEYATFDGVQLRGLYKDGSIRKGVMENNTIHLEYENLKKLILSFSFSEIHDIEMFQCMIATYGMFEPEYFLSEIDESATYDISRSEHAKLAYNKTLDDYSIVRNDNSQLELRIFGENVVCIDFNIE